MYVMNLFLVSPFSFPLTHMSILMLIPHHLENCGHTLKPVNMILRVFTENFTQPENQVLTTLKYKEEKYKSYIFLPTMINIKNWI